MESHICGVSSYVYVHVICLIHMNLIYSSMFMTLLCRITHFIIKITYHFYTHWASSSTTKESDNFVLNYMYIV